MVTAHVILLLALSSPGDTVLLDFSSTSCVPCRQMEPTVQRLISSGYPVRKVDVNQEPQLTARFRVTAVPCFVLVSGGREVDRVVGPASHARLVQMFSRSARNTPVASPTGDQVRGQSPGGPLAALSLPDPRRLFGGRDKPAPSQPPTGFPAPTGSPGNGVLHRTTSMDRALAATVRLQVEDPTGHSFGTGTVIDVHAKEALIVTCAHIFRESGGRGNVRVDLFREGRVSTVLGTLISFDLERDVALVSVTPDSALVPAQVAPAGTRFRAGDPVFSVGCDQGRDPSIRTSRINSVDKYLGPPNIEAAGEPVNGRSGGGLFTENGLLIGICNCADPADNEGIYASLPNIHWELDRIGQQRVYAGQPAVPAASQLTAANLGPVAPGSAAAVGPPRATLSDTEVICIVRSRTQPGQGEQLLILSDPSQDLLDRITSESSSPGVLASRGNPARQATPTQLLRQEPIVRAQSKGR